MRIALVHNFHAGDVPSGEDVVVSAEADALARAGHEVRVVGTGNDEMAVRRLARVRAAVTVATGVGVSPERELGAFGPDVVHVHNLFPYLDRHWLRRLDVPVVATVHSYRAVCANGYLFRDGAVCTRCLDGRRWSGVRYGCYRGSRLQTLPHAIGTARGAGHDPVLACAARVLALSDRSRSVLVRAGVPADRIVLDHHFLPDELATGPALPSAGSGWTYVGRLSPEKGVDRLVAQWSADEPLQVVGDGELRAELERMAAGKRVTFTGRLSRAEAQQRVRGSYGLLFPSRWYETFGLVYIEGLAAGVPTLAFRPTVVADAVEREGTGLVGSWDALDASLAEARERFPGLRARCRQVFEERYAEPAFVERRIALYAGVTDSSGRVGTSHGLEASRSTQ